MAQASTAPAEPRTTSAGPAQPSPPPAGSSPRSPLEALVRRLEAVPLRRRLVAIVASLVGAALVLTSLATAYLMRSDLMDRVDAELRSVATPVASQAFDDLRTRETLPSSYAFQLQSPGADIYKAPIGARSTPLIPELAVDDVRVRSGRPFTVRSRDGGARWRFVAGRVVGQDATFAVGVPLDSVTHTVTRLLVLAALIGTAVLALSVVLARFAVRRAFRPLSRIEDTAAAIAGGDLSQRVPERQADDEVTSLTRSLNTMLSRVESSFAVREASEERMRQFVADASHELRTPLATVRGYAELYRQGAVRDPEAVAGAMERIEAESGRMSGLVEDLLTLARIDDAPEVEAGPVDLTVLAADAVADARVRAPERRIQLLGLEGPGRPDDDHRGRGPAAPGRDQPRGKRVAAHPGRDAGRGRRRHRRPRDRPRGARPRDRSALGGRDEGVRAVLPRRPVARPDPGWRQRPRPRDRRRDRRPAPGPRRRRGDPRRRSDLRRATSTAGSQRLTSARPPRRA